MSVPYGRGVWAEEPRRKIGGDAAPIVLGPAAPGLESIPEQYLILVKCRDEGRQVELLERFGRAGLECRALLA